MVERLSIARLDPDDPRPTFDCGDSDLNEFFHVDSITAGRELLAVTYVFKINGDAVAFISVSNDAIKKEDLTRSRHKRIMQLIPREKRYSSMPAVKIGRFATCANMQSKGVGTEIMGFLKYWFTHGNKTGCRFIIVDAYNREKTIRFYTRNGFDYLTTTDKQDETRLMWFDLSTFRPE